MIERERKASFYSSFCGVGLGMLFGVLLEYFYNAARSAFKEILECFWRAFWIILLCFAYVGGTISGPWPALDARRGFLVIKNKKKDTLSKTLRQARVFEEKATLLSSVAETAKRREDPSASDRSGAAEAETSRLGSY